MNNPTQRFIFVAALCLMATSCSKSKEQTTQSKSNSSEPAVELKMKWTPGRKIVQRLEMAASTEVNLNKQKMQQVMIASWDYSMGMVKQLENGGCQVELEFVATKLESKAGDRVYTLFDSAHDDGKQSKFPMAAAFRKLVGAKVDYILSRDNKVERLEGYDDFMVRIARGSSNPEMLKTMFNEETLKRLCSWGDALPDHPVRPGDSWKYSSEMNLYGMTKMVIDGTFTFKNWEDHDGHKCVKLDYDGKISGTKGGRLPQIEGGKVHGSSWFDPEQGVGIGAESDQTMAFKYDLNGKSTSQQVRQNVTIRLVQ